MRPVLAGVDDFYAAVGFELPGRGEKAPIRCFAAPDAHKRDDRDPSAEVDRRSGYWRCHGCGEWGGPYDAALALGVRPAEAMELLERHGLKREKNGDRPDSRRGNGRVPNGKPQAPAKPPASEDQLAHWRDQLLRNEPLLARLRQLRGWTRPTIEALGLGVDGDRITFPVRGGAGELLDVLRYKPGNRADGERKLLASKGCQRALFPPPERVEGEPIWIVEGESDAVSARELGLAAVGVPGANKWDESWSARFAGRSALVVLDCDDEGRAAARRIAESLGAHAATVKVLDLDPGRDDGYDLSDLLLEAGEDHADARRMLLRMALEAPRLEPPEAVAGAELLDEIVTFYRRFVLMTPAQAAVMALWVVHTHAIVFSEATAYVFASSAEKRSGKSRLLEVAAELVPSPLEAANISDAALFRAIALKAPTLLFDETDAVFGPKARDREDLRSLLNAGYRRSAQVWRCVGEGAKLEVKSFPVFCAKALAGIGELPDTLADRCFPIRLERQAPGERVERFRRRDVQAEAGALRERIERFVELVHDELDGARPSLPPELDDRGQDAAEPLLAIADAAGAEWPARARQAVVELRSHRQVEDESLGIRLLADVRAVFDGRGVDRVSTAALLEALHAIDEAPWGDWYGKPLSSRKLADLLKPYGIRSRTIRLDDGTTPKGYLRGQLEAAFSRYLPSIRHNATTRIPKPKIADLETPHDADVADNEEAAIPLHERDVAGVADTDGARTATDAEEAEAKRLATKFGGAL